MEKYEEAQVFRQATEQGEWILLVVPNRFGAFDWSLIDPYGALETDGSALNAREAVTQAREAIDMDGPL